MSNYRPLPREVTIKESHIHGLGLYAVEHIEAHYTIGISHVKDDRFPQGWIRTPLGGFYNHSDKPNCVSIADAPLEGENYSRKMVASRDISPDEEITTNYKLQPDLEQPGEWAIQ